MSSRMEENLKIKKIPMRMCVGCKEMKPKKEMLRIVKKQDGTIVADASGKVAGRGAYICKDEACINACIKNKAINKAFEMQIQPEIYEAIKEELLNLDKTE